MLRLHRIMARNACHLIILVGLIFGFLSTNAFANTPQVSYSLGISENLAVLKAPNDMHAQMMAAWTTPTQLAMERNRPYLLLENTSTAANDGDGNASLTTFSMTIGDTTQNFDWARIVSMSPGVTATLVTPDTLDNGSHNQIIKYNFTGLTPGKQVIFEVDIDPNMATANPFTDYRKVLFNLNGGADVSKNSQLSASFFDASASPSTMSLGPAPWQIKLPDGTSANPVDARPTVFGMEFVSHYMADHVTSFSTSNIETVPEPSSLCLAGLAAVGMIAYRRRSANVSR